MRVARSLATHVLTVLLHTSVPNAMPKASDAVLLMTARAATCSPPCALKYLPSLPRLQLDNCAAS
eukprot:8580353-Pyramimonas_sp.AAC.1